MIGCKQFPPFLQGGFYGLVLQKPFSQAGADLPKQRLVRVQKPQRQPAAGERAACFFLKDRDDAGEGAFYGIGVYDLAGGGVLPGRLQGGAGQGGEAFPAAGDGGNDRYAQLLGKQSGLYPDAFLFRFIHQVDAYDDPGGDLHGLEGQIQAAFQAGGVAYDYDRVRLSEAEKIPRDLFLRRMRHKGVGAREIHQNAGLSFADALSLGVGHRLARPVSRVLLHAGQPVENGTFSHVGIPRQGNDLLFCALPLDHKAGIQGIRSGRMTGKSHMICLLRL